jgi:hypothetical protein
MAYTKKVIREAMYFVARPTGDYSWETPDRETAILTLHTAKDCCNCYLPQIPPDDSTFPKRFIYKSVKFRIREARKKQS